MKIQIIMCDGTVACHRIECTKPQHVTVLSPSDEIVFVPLTIYRDHVIFESCIVTLGEMCEPLPAGNYKVVIVEG